MNTSTADSNLAALEKKCCLTYLLNDQLLKGFPVFTALSTFYLASYSGRSPAAANIDCIVNDKL